MIVSSLTIGGEQQVGGEEEQKVAHVVEADAGVEPRAVVVQSRHAPAPAAEDIAQRQPKRQDRFHRSA